MKLLRNQKEFFQVVGRFLTNLDSKEYKEKGHIYSELESDIETTELLTEDQKEEAKLAAKELLDFTFENII